jgi:MoaA/NifB/PqqE/SkfB family radical SAM enzyme
MFRFDKMIQQFTTHSPLCSWREVGKYTLIVDHINKKLITLTGVAGLIWKITEGWVHIDEVVNAIVAKYEIDKNTAYTDAICFLSDLSKFELIISTSTDDNQYHSRREILQTYSDFKDGIPVEVRKYCQKNNIPLVAYLELTQICNLNCAHCYNAHPPGEELSLNEIQFILDQLIELGSLDLVITGGEPLTSKYFVDVLRYAKKRNFCITVKSNASLVNDYILQEMLKALVVEVQVSIYSTISQEHEAITRVPGSLKKTIAGVKKMLDSGLSVSLSCPVTKLNYRSLNLVNDFATSLGIHVGFDPIITPKVDGSADPTYLRLEKKEWDYLLKNNFIAEVMYPSVENIPDHGMRDKASVDSGNNPFCGAGSTSIAINCVGNVVPCVVFPKSMGNTREKSIIDIWKNNEWDIIRNFKRNDFLLCNACEKQNRCLRCPAVSLSESGKLHEPLPIFCMAAEYYSASE